MAETMTPPNLGDVAQRILDEHIRQGRPQHLICRLGYLNDDLLDMEPLAKALYVLGDPTNLEAVEIRHFGSRDNLDFMSQPESWNPPSDKYWSIYWQSKYLELQLRLEPNSMEPGVSVSLANVSEKVLQWVIAKYGKPKAKRIMLGPVEWVDTNGGMLKRDNGTSIVLRRYARTNSDKYSPEESLQYKCFVFLAHKYQSNIAADVATFTTSDLPQESDTKDALSKLRDKLEGLDFDLDSYLTHHRQGKTELYTLNIEKLKSLSSA